MLPLTPPKRFPLPGGVRPAVLCALAGLAQAGLASGGGTSGDDVAAVIAAMWKDPTFQKQFVGSYGINAELEPRVSPDEVKLLEKVQPLMADDLPRARSVLAKAMEDDCSAMLDMTLANIHFQQDDLAGALAGYRTAVRKFPSFRRAWRNIGIIQARNGEYDEAIRAFTKMIELGGGDASSYGMLGHAYAAKLDHQAAEMAYRNALLLQPDSAEWRLRVTRCVLVQKKYEDAAALLDVLIERFPDKPDFWIYQAEAYIGMQQPLLAAANLEALDLMNAASADTLYTLGDIYVREQHMDLAARAYVRALEVEPNQDVAKPMRAAEVLASRGAMAQARAVAARVRELLGDRLQAAERTKLLKLEARLSMAEGGGDAGTAAVLEEIIRLDPLDGEALLLLGQHYLRQGEPDRAIFYYERAAGMEAFEVNARVRHAQVLVGMGRYADALPLLRRAQELRPRDDVARYLEQVERVAKSRR